MKKFITYLTIVSTIVIFAACQKELRFAPVVPTGEAQGTFQVNSAGSCFLQSVSGLYIKDTALNSSNFIEAVVNVTKTGWYKISTDTIDGMYFSDSGSFTRIQTETIILKGKGTPISVGIKNFTVKFGNQSSCKIAVTVTTGGTTNPNAVFTITSCGSPILSGPVYTVGTTVSTLNTVMFNVNVTNIGTYSITSNTVNGITFTASGSYSGVGSNSVILTASGTPTAAGTFNYTINTGTSSCTFPITVVTGTPPPPPANLDYIPMTTNTNWTNKVITIPPPTPDTTFLQVNPNQKIFGANSYHIFERKVTGTPQDSTYFRKNGGLYYQYINGRIANTTVPINQEYLVLDSTKAINIPWSTNLGNIVFNGIPLNNFTITGRITARGTTQTVESIVYNNVIIVQYDYAATVFGVPTSFATEERWFAKGIGIIKSVIDIPLQSLTIENRLTRSQIF
ncbi:MAG: hypothetical protein KA319_03205 [Ferruginibacter sp.]|nr:hypothetical protein [Ferruginibacter sp.]